MRSRRSLIDYSLARRATLARLSTGGATRSDACDAQPYLLRAAKYHGDPVAEPCPVCRRQALTTVSYTYGEELGEDNGRARRQRELLAMEAAHVEFTVYVVEVCPDCGWNHLTMSFVLGAAPRSARRRCRAAQP